MSILQTRKMLVEYSGVRDADILQHVHEIVKSQGSCSDLAEGRELIEIRSATRPG